MTHTIKAIALTLAAGCLCSAALAADVCSQCHSTGGKYAIQNQNSTQIHSLHAAKQDCTNCHSYSNGVLTLKGGSAWKLELDEGTWELYRKIYASLGEGAQTAAARHARRGLNCAACHDESHPQELSEVDNAKCESCHGPQEKIALKTAMRSNPKVNPHQSHQGKMPCSTCHKGHDKVVNYCEGCHSPYKMTMPETALK